MRVRVDFFALIIETPDTFCTNEIHQHQFFSKQMRLFKSIFILWHIIISVINSDLTMLQHRSVFHIRSVQMSTERKMC